jgi:hypothetical protein
MKFDWLEQKYHAAKISAKPGSKAKAHDQPFHMEKVPVQLEVSSASSWAALVAGGQTAEEAS